MPSGVTIESVEEPRPIYGAPPLLFSPHVRLEARGPDFPRVADIECSIGSGLPPSQRAGTLTFPDAITFLKYFLCPKCMPLRRPKLVENGERWTIGQTYHEDVETKRRAVQEGLSFLALLSGFHWTAGGSPAELDVDAGTACAGGAGVAMLERAQAEAEKEQAQSTTAVEGELKHLVLVLIVPRVVLDGKMRGDGEEISDCDGELSFDETGSNAGEMVTEMRNLRVTEGSVNTPPKGISRPMSIG
ncbi:hypothetical protein B0H13DRAFT_1904094 [Mycena leptocephala]|nr:hypothetical protein B0H13DRAFT_1904094 [Mycena leptocephala]